ncbi:hypothetical protein MASR2M15_06880 [Anaerolineales bacterium]
MNDKKAYERYERIIEISQQLNSTLELPVLLRKIVYAAEELIDAEAASIILYDEATSQLHFMVGSNLKPHEVEDIAIPLEGSIAGWIFSHGEPRVIQNVEEEPGHYAGVDSKIQFKTRNLLGVPMRTHERTIGVLQAVNKHDGLFTDDDISTLKTLASQAGLAIENARLFQQNDFIAEMVHELRTPLLALKASTTLLGRTELPEEKRADIVDTMRLETDRLISLTNDFLDVARYESGRANIEADFFDLIVLFRESAAIVEPQAHEKVLTIWIEDFDYDREILADRGKIKQVLLNLLTNAIKYNREAGQIYLSAKIVNENENPFVQISVRDTGYGIPDEHMQGMFQKFFRVPTTANIARGTGLGLTICKAIVEAHGGHIWLQSKVDVGTTFSFKLPLHQIEEA